MKVQLDDWRVEFLREAEFPFVMIGHTEESVGASFIDYDFEAAVRLGLNHLAALGHRSIGFVSATPAQGSQHGPTVRALRAYVDACTEMGLPKLQYETDHGLRHIRLMTSRMLSEQPEITALIQSERWWRRCLVRFTTQGFAFPMTYLWSVLRIPRALS